MRAGRPALSIAEMPDADLQNVVIALTHTVMHKLGAKHDHPTTGKGTKAEDDHEVGARKSPAQPGVSSLPPARTAAPAIYAQEGLEGWNQEI